MSDYGTMQARIADELARSDLAAQIPRAIQSAIRFFEGERFWFNEAEATAATVAGQQAYAVPGDFLAADELTATVSGSRYALAARGWNWMRRVSVTAAARGQPTDWAYYADQFWLHPVPDGAYTLTLSYLKRLGTLSAAADTNAWMTHGEELVRARAKADLLANLIGDMEAAAAMNLIAQGALATLRARSAARLSSGRIAPTRF